MRAAFVMNAARPDAPSSTSTFRGNGANTKEYNSSRHLSLFSNSGRATPGSSLEATPGAADRYDGGFDYYHQEYQEKSKLPLITMNTVMIEQLPKVRPRMPGTQ